MSVSCEAIENALDQFGLQHSITSLHKFIDYYEEAGQEVKVIAKVECADRAPLVVKILKEPEHPASVIESQSVFSEYLRTRGVWTARRYAHKGRYCMPYGWKGLDAVVTVEDYLGEEIHTVDFPLARRIGQLQGRIHTLSEKGGCRIGKDTIFNFLGYNEVSGYETFCELGRAGKLNEAMFKHIQALYEAQLDCVKRLWDKLPRFATQGDLSINNLTCDGADIGIFDYNIAGDATLVSDMILQGLLTANEMPLAEGLTDADRPEIFRLFCQGYCEERELSDAERQAAGPLLALSKAFWFTAIRYDDDSLEKLAERNERQRIERKLKDIYRTLQDKRPNQ